MLREELTAKLAAFEGKHPVDEWTWRGWRAWPVLRARLSLSLTPKPQRAAPTGLSRLSGSLAWRARRLRAWSVRARAVQRRPDRPTGLVFVTRTNRAQRVGRRVRNGLVDPWVEEAARGGLSASVWDLGVPRPRAHPAHVSIEPAIEERRRQAAASRSAPPPWLDRFADLVANELDGDLGWPELRFDLECVDAFADLFGPWLRRAAPRAVVLDGWYLRESLGAALAAHRAGIPSVDLQHGIQGRGHPAYAGWTRRPPGGYEVFPDRFWVWGSWDADSLVAENAGAIAPEDVRVVGNRWLGAWAQPEPSREIGREIHAAGRLVGPRRSVLVTLQKGVPWRDTLLPLLAAAPHDWLWLVRQHRSVRDDPRHLQSALRAGSGRDVMVVEATRRPLYALMRSVAWHVTAFSTCALEALAFGVPTLLTHPSGAHAFAEFVEAGVMREHRSVQESLALLAGDPEGLDDVCRRLARRVFAPPVAGIPL